MTQKKIIGGGIAAVVLITAILLANWVTTDYGFIPIGFGLSATSGTIFAGFALASRDAIQDAWGRIAVIIMILIGTAVSFGIAAAAIALASAAAFFTSEALNYAVYTPLRNKSKLGDRRWAVAVVSSNIVGAVTDTVIFLGIAFGFASVMPALAGQMVGKMYATILYLVIGALIGLLIKRRATKKQPAQVS